MWERHESPAFSPVLRKPNRYQTINKFVEQWITSKLMWGNTYVLKERDARGVVVALYVLDPCRVTPLVAPDGGIYYQLQPRQSLGRPGRPRREDSVIVPAREIIHDRMVCLFHPLVGVSPILRVRPRRRCKGLAIQNTSTPVLHQRQPAERLADGAGRHDAGAARPGQDRLGNVQRPGERRQGRGLTADIKYTPLTMNAVDAQLIEQLKWTGARRSAAAIHVRRT